MKKRILVTGVPHTGTTILRKLIGRSAGVIDEEREYSGNSFYEKMCEGDYSEKSDGLQPIYDLKHTTNYGDWIDKDVEEVDRFDIFDGVDRVWISKTDNLKKEE